MAVITAVGLSALWNNSKFREHTFTTVTTDNHTINWMVGNEQLRGRY